MAAEVQRETSSHAQALGFTHNSRWAVDLRHVTRALQDCPHGLHRSQVLVYLERVVHRSHIFVPSVTPEVRLAVLAVDASDLSLFLSGLPGPRPASPCCLFVPLRCALFRAASCEPDDSRLRLFSPLEMSVLSVHPAGSSPNSPSAFRFDGLLPPSSPEFRCFRACLLLLFLILTSARTPAFLSTGRQIHRGLSASLGLHPLRTVHWISTFRPFFVMRPCRC